MAGLALAGGSCGASTVYLGAAAGRTPPPWSSPGIRAACWEESDEGLISHPVMGGVGAPWEASRSSERPQHVCDRRSHGGGCLGRALHLAGGLC